MPKKRRKLNRELESEISQAFKKVELITAQINDIQEDDILSEYRLAFDPVRNTFLLLKTLYDSEGVTPQSEQILATNKSLQIKFEAEQ